jgi:nitroimidazol reductase NimA-like FMN-containing flavoprotein (pyridoxamine 5'-phosphate oxidase superfamily)
MTSLPTTGLEVLDVVECRHLLETGTLGRVLLSVNALPAAFPVNYRLRGDTIVFRTGPGTKLSRARDVTVVGFEVDHVDAATGTGWNVLVIGSASTVCDADEIAMLEQLQIPSLAGDRLPHFVQISVDSISGRRIPASTP